MYDLTTLQRAIALGTAGLALTASPVLAQPDHPTTHVTQSPAGAAGGLTLDLRTPDAIDAASGPKLDLRTPDAVDAAQSQARQTSSLAGTTSASPRAAAAVASTDTDDGIDWGAIAIGAGGIVAVSLIGLGGVAVTQHGRVRTAR
ncbi:hypothetical protein DSM104299_03085 [Baekduia alba]|uniref:hypothetical protein n=1 Tax=Baekduia alba TaxID=2997333 RepID=UPI002340F15E|nr:hypothetical protein [Baekduia alba]WCB94351.1 hypothetical protein DSM104299_03085 [Baekduia alba]